MHTLNLAAQTSLLLLLTSNIEVNKVEEVNINSENKKSTDSKIKKKEIENVKKIISEEYNISEEKIEVN